jgi:hypothetical protein
MSVTVTVRSELRSSSQSAAGMAQATHGTLYNMRDKADVGQKARRTAESVKLEDHLTSLTAHHLSLAQPANTGAGQSIELLPAPTAATTVNTSHR